MKLKLTDEQQTIVDYDGKKNLIIEAKAGSGKSSVLYDFAKARPSRRFLYLVFSAAMKPEAEEKYKDITNVKILTTFGLAYSAKGKFYRNKLTGSYRAYDLAKDMGMGFRNQSDKNYVYMLLNIWNSYLKSPIDEIEEFTKDYNLGKSQIKKVNQLINKLFKLKKDRKNEVMVQHSFYMKLYVMSSPILTDYDYILLDEAQDSSEPIVKLLNGQSHAKLVLVGDEFQNIFSFAGSTNALAKFEGSRLQINTSFRVGQGSADIVNKVYNSFGYESKMIGINNDQKIVRSIDRHNPHAIICRSRSFVFKNAIEAIDSNKLIYFVGGAKGYNFQSFKDAYWFSRNKKSKYDRLFNGYDKWSDLLDDIKSEDENIDQELKFLVKLVQQYGDQILKYVDLIDKNSTNKIDEADVILSTCHKSKGLEFEQDMILEDDFIDLCELRDELSAIENDKELHDKLLEDSKEQLNVWYVGLTRSKGKLQLNDKTINFIK